MIHITLVPVINVADARQRYMVIESQQSFGIARQGVFAIVQAMAEGF